MNEIITILILVGMGISVAALIYSIKANKQLEQKWDDRQEFYSSDCDESMVEVLGFNVNPETREIIEWRVKYGSATFPVPHNNLDMTKYLNEDEIKWMEDFINRKNNRLKGIDWSQVIRNL